MTRRRSRLFGIAVALVGQTALAAPLFEDFTAKLGHTHHENAFDDFARQLLLPNRLGQLGPGVAWCDLNDDGRDDLVTGSGKGGNLAILLSQPSGRFDSVQAPEFKAAADFTGVAAWRTANGAMHMLAGIANYEDEDVRREAVRRWELTKEFGKKDAVAPGMRSSTGPIALADVDADGDLDLFVGGRTVPGRYPEPASSRLFRREGDRFVSDEHAALAFKDLGLVSGAVFSDLNGDGFADLVLAMEWGPVRVFVNDTTGQFVEQTERLGLGKLTGWWNGVTTGDLDGDGRLDIVATNWGLNTKYRASLAHPLITYYGEFENPGRLDIIEAHFDEAMQKLVPERGFGALSSAMPFLKSRVSSFKEYGELALGELFGDRLKKAASVSANTLEHMIFFNRGESFEPRVLPIEAQFAPAFGVSVADLDGDAAEDVIMTQNFFAAQPETPRSDAGRSLFLRGDGKGGLGPVPGHESGILVYGDARGLAVGDFDADRRPDVAIGQNGAATKLFRNAGAKPALRIVLRGPEGNPQGFGAQVRLQFGERLGPVREVHGGSGFWSQDSATVLLSGGAEQPTGVWVRWPGGKVTSHPLSGGVETMTATFDR